MKMVASRALIFIIVLGELVLEPAAIPIQSASENGGEAEGYKTVIVAVKNRNAKQIEDILLDVSDPASKNYGKHLTLDQVCRITEPHDEHVRVVHEWAATHEAERMDATACNDFIIFRMPVNRISGALESASLLSHAIDFVDSSTTNLIDHFKRSTRNFNPAARRAQQGNDEGAILPKPKPDGPWYPACLKTSAIPDCLRKLHNVTVDQNTAEHNSQAVALFGPQFFRPSDLAAFEAKYHVPPSEIRVLNDNNPAIAGNEASLDTQYISAMGPGIETWFLHYNCTSEACKPFLTWVIQVSNLTSPPLVHSVSVGTTEWAYVEAMGEAFVSRVNLEFAKLGARGASLLFAAGDTAAQRHGGAYWVNFPSASPHVTAVGGVWLGALGGGPLVTDPDTTGGFANCPVHAQPAHQRPAVEGYLAAAAARKAKQPPVFNATLRAVPDVVSMSDAYVIIQGGAETFIGGTSAACPVVAGLVGLLNGARLAAGRPAMGHVAPFLYAHPECFEDIVGGANLYEAIEGWDPATGLGSPVFSCLLRAAMA